LSRAGLFQGV